MKKYDIDGRLKEIYVIIGHNVSRLRGGMKKKELAKKAHLSRQTISMIEKGGPINLQTLIKIADALEVSPADLFITDINRGEITWMHIKLFKAISESLKLEQKK